MTKAELASGGFSPGSRRYTTAKPGRYRPGSPSLSRRQAEQPVVGLTFEKAAEARAIYTGGKSRLSLSITGQRLEQPASGADWSIRQWAEVHDLTYGEARADPERQAAWAAIRRGKATPRHSRARSPQSAYAKALVQLGLRDPNSQKDVGDS